MDFNNITATWAPRILSLLRIVAALLFIEHGTQKLFAFPPGGMQPPITSIYGIAALLEVVGGTLLLLGLFTRPVAFLLSGQMAVAYFHSHAPQSFFPVNNKGDAAILFCFVFLYIAAAGPGPLSVDAQMRRGTKAS